MIVALLCLLALVLELVVAPCCLSCASTVGCTETTQSGTRFSSTVADWTGIDGLDNAFTSSFAGFATTGAEGETCSVIGTVAVAVCGASDVDADAEVVVLLFTDTLSSVFTSSAASTQFADE